MTWWQTNGWTSRLQWPTSCPPALPTSYPAPSARPAWTTPARGRGAPPTTSKDTREERRMGRGETEKWKLNKDETLEGRWGNNNIKATGGIKGGKKKKSNVEAAARLVFLTTWLPVRNYSSKCIPIIVPVQLQLVPNEYTCAYQTLSAPVQQIVCSIITAASETNHQHICVSLQDWWLLLWVSSKTTRC